MARTNKMWILKKKQQQAKQKKLVWESSVSNETIKKTYENPAWNQYLRVKISQKYICDVTSRREDPDWYRLVRKSSGWEIDFLQTFGWGYKKYLKKFRKLARSK